MPSPAMRVSSDSNHRPPVGARTSISHVSGVSLLAGAATHLLPRCSFPAPGTPVTCAVSGGADSLALLVLAVAAGCRPSAVHVDHGLRPGSDREFELVARVAEQLGVEARTVRVHVCDGPNLEARAREARYSVLPTDVLTGHTADDQAETVLINLLRGAGSDGLSAMRPGPHRPLLALRRHQTHALCAALALDVVDDTSNADRRFLRNRIRLDLLPALAEAAARDLVPVLTRQADLLRDEADLLDQLATAIDPTDARELAAAHPALARRAIRRWLGGDGHPPDAATVARVLDVASGRSVGCDIGRGRRVTRSRQRLSLIDP
jgi:tRNA(Ile)-lysidine synthase